MEEEAWIIWFCPFNSLNDLHITELPKPWLSHIQHGNVEWALKNLLSTIQWIKKILTVDSVLPHGRTWNSININNQELLLYIMIRFPRADGKRYYSKLELLSLRNYIFMEKDREKPLFFFFFDTLWIGPRASSYDTSLYHVIPTFINFILRQGLDHLLCPACPHCPASVSSETGLLGVCHRDS